MPIALTEDQRALAELLRSWERRRQPRGAGRTMETDPDAWRPVWTELGELGVLDLARPGSGGTVTDLAVVLEQAAEAMVPGPVLTTALAGLVVGVDVDLGDRTVGVALAPAELATGERGLLSGTVRPVLGAAPDALALVSDADGAWCLVDAA